MKTNIPYFYYFRVEFIFIHHYFSVSMFVCNEDNMYLKTVIYALRNYGGV